VSRPTRGPLSRFPVRGCHPLRPAFPDASGTKDNGHWPVPRSLATTDGISQRRLSPPPSRAACAARVLMSVPPATEMFQFAGFASRPYEFRSRYPLRGGLPHSEIPGSPIARISPGLFAACHVLRRLSVPRHPPDALVSRLITASPSPAMPHHRRAQGQTPCLAPAKSRAAASHEDTSLGPARSKRCLPQARPPRSHHNSLCTLQSTPRRSPAAVSSNLLRTSLSRCRGRQPCRRHADKRAGARATPVARQTAGSPVGPLGAAPLHLSAGSALLYRWWR
jgi:hypothetical protein